MPKLHLLLKAELENVTNLRPSSLDHQWNFQVKCTSCHEQHDSWISFNATDTSEIPNSRGSANFVLKCKSCKTQTNASILSDSFKPYTAENGAEQPVFTIETRGLDFVGWRPANGQIWIVEGVESGVVFEDVEFEDGELDWAGYDEKAQCSVGVNGICGEFVKAK
ncbi:hypothetical protein BJ741DRAFT_624885 [Chytriomyces cf. hyalinus JEL632]|nr:hypothetical protein BJ741DRAFT_624885 [Chytriomyces cf. hyalinus JEL632]